MASETKPDITKALKDNKRLPINFDDLPDMISVKDLEPYYARYSIMAMFHQKNFPYVQIGKAFYTPKHKFIKWLEERSETNHKSNCTC